MNTDTGGTQAEVAETEPLTMFLVLRKDLQKNLGWPTGSVVTQGAHAATAVLHLQQDDPDVIDYFKDLPRMHKVTYEVDRTAGEYTDLLGNETVPSLSNRGSIEKV
ncbi:peptidyl-tRNA hydrolase domain-containing protein 1 [Gaertneriomyces sp. JEL0708]|nr:peptidyl-tRNA hydrolase domain-containing protein 1 [Gaertneriomyces sp. JEL0708]